MQRTWRRVEQINREEQETREQRRFKHSKRRGAQPPRSPFRRRTHLRMGAALASPTNATSDQQQRPAPVPRTPCPLLPPGTLAVGRKLSRVARRRRSQLDSEGRVCLRNVHRARAATRQRLA
ncbi:hypothetical protein TRVL_06591 [Trypanosoma vivax]|nr:hypothetical protein TRVL_06591 [Trypanosoma vivax]